MGAEQFTNNQLLGSRLADIRFSNKSLTRKSFTWRPINLKKLSYKNVYCCPNLKILAVTEFNWMQAEAFFSSLCVW